VCVAVRSTCCIQCTSRVKCITYVGDTTHPFVSQDSCTWIHCVYIYMHKYVYTYIYLMHTSRWYMRERKNVFLCMDTFASMIAHILHQRMKRHELRVCACIRIHIYVIFLCIHVNVYKYMDIHIYIYIYIKVFISRKEMVCIFKIWWFFEKISVLPSATSSACV